jgi:hypothetical protein
LRAKLFPSKKIRLYKSDSFTQIIRIASHTDQPDIQTFRRPRMKRAPFPGPADRAPMTRHNDPLRLADIVQALCAGLSPSAEGLEQMLDRIESVS